MVRVAQRPVSTARSYQAPVGGWNARDALGAMPLNDAPIMTNFFPTTTNVWLRYGYSQYATGISGQVETILAYNGVSAGKMFAVATSGNIYDVTAGGAVGAAVVSALTNARFQYINTTTAGGSFLMAVNGSDKLEYYDGTTWSADGTTYTITGVNTVNCSNINLFKNRVWLVQENTLDAWYLPTNAIQGAATKFPLGGVAQKGGSLIAMATWTIDAGYGVDDLAVFITSQGEVIVYRGTDPSAAATFALVGVWQLGTPVGARCFMKYAGDMLYICQDGVIPMSAALQSSRLNPRVSLTDKITFAMSQAISLYGANFGWELMYFPKENQLYLNVPTSEGSQQQQYVMNTITKSWCNFTGWEANTWCLFNDSPYFGGDGFVGLAWDTLADNSTDIQAFCIQAFSDYGSSNVQKRFSMARFYLFTNGSPNILGEVNVDFDLSDSTAALAFSGTAAATWDSGVWDTGVWGTDLALQQNWQGVTGIGYYGAPVLKVSAQGIQVQWNSTTVVYEKGGVL